MIYQFLLFRKTGELILSIDLTEQKIDPALVTGFISAIYTFSAEIVGHKVSTISTDTHQFLIDKISDGLLAAILIDQQESLIDIKLRMRAIKNYFTINFPTIDDMTNLQSTTVLKNARDKIEEILTRFSFTTSKHVLRDVKNVGERLVDNKIIKGLLILDKNCKVIATINVTEEERLVISKELESLIGVRTEFTPQKMIIFTEKQAIAIRIAQDITLAVITPANVDSKKVFNVLEKNIDKVVHALKVIKL